MANSRPLLTVFTTFHRETAYLDQTIASVLAQSFRDFEYLIINDGDPEESDRLAARFTDPRLRFINQKREGLMRSRNRGLREARGELIAMIDADDLCEAGRFEQQVAFLRENPNHVLVGSALRLIDASSRTIGYRTYPMSDTEIRGRIVAFNCIAQPAVMARREILIQAGGYRPEFEWAEDYDLWLRAARLGKLHNLSDPLVAYRIHPEAGKRTRLRPSLRDSTRLKIHAIRHYGFRLTPRVAASIALHGVLLLLPSPLVYWFFTRMMVRRRAFSRES